MEALVNAVSEFLAAIFARLGYVGRTRRRASIRDEIGLLKMFRESPAFGIDSRAAQSLSEHITREVERYAGVEPKSKVEWGSVAAAAIIGIPLGYWTYKLNQGGFSWVSLFPGTVSVLMLIAVLGVAFQPGHPA